MTELEYITFKDADGLDKLNDGSHALIYGSMKDKEIDSARYGARVEDFYIMSALIKPRDFKKYLEVEEFFNYPFADLGNPGIWKTGESDKIHFTLGQERSANGIKAHYFVRSYYPRGHKEPRYPVAQSFIFYHGLTEHSRRYNHVYVDELTDLEVIREEIHPDRNGQFRVKINRHYLREYLAARKMGLAVWLSIHRYATLDKDIDPIDKRDGNQMLIVRKADWLQNKGQKVYMSELVIKTIIKPYKDISWSSKNWDRDEEEPNIPMIIKIDEDTGKQVLSDKSTPFLTSVYFKKEVLGKYIDDDRSSVGTASEGLGHVNYLDQWSLTYGLNSLDRVIVWLGDLQKLSYEEQTYWRHFNIPPEGGMADEFFKSQIEGQWVESRSLESRLTDVRKEINNITSERFGAPLFTPTSDDEEHEKQLHTAIKKGSKALRPQIGALAKLFIDAIDKPLLAKLIDDEALLVDGKGNKKGSIALLQALFTKETGSELEINTTLQLIWIIRGLYSHVFDEKAYIDVIGKYDSRLDPLDPSTLYPFIMKQLIRELGWFKSMWDEETEQSVAQ